MKYCCPHVPKGSNKFVQCFTEFISEEGDWYRGHPNYHGKRWCDHAMINWNLEFPLPGLIHTFVDLRHLPDSIRIRTNQQSNLKAGMYAVLESYDAEDSDPAVPNNMIGLYTLHRKPDEGGIMPVSIYLIDVESIFAPTVGIPDFGNNDSDKYLFLFRREERNGHRHGIILYSIVARTWRRKPWSLNMRTIKLPLTNPRHPIGQQEMMRMRMPIKYSLCHAS